MHLNTLVIVTDECIQVKLKCGVSCPLITRVYRATAYVTESISIVKESFDNDATPFYALIVTIWGMWVLFLGGLKGQMTAKFN